MKTLRSILEANTQSQKLVGYCCVVIIGNIINIFASTGILYNHESPYRKDTYLSKKITKAAVHISEGLQDKLVLGSLSSTADWGYAPDFVDAMVKMLAIETPKEFIISTGIKHTVKDFVEIAFEHVGLELESLCL